MLKFLRVSGKSYFLHAVKVLICVLYTESLEKGKIEIEFVETAAEVLYGLIHARFILTAKGMQRMVVCVT